MLTIIIVFFIGKYFYELAHDYNKHRGLYAVLGVLMYFFAAFVLEIIYFIAIVYFDLKISSFRFFGINLITLLVGTIAVYFFHLFLDTKWKKAEDASANEIDDIGKDIT